jgi:hypothetical protein
VGKKVLLVGWHPSAVNYDKWPGLTPEKLEAGLKADESNLNDLGYKATLGFIYDSETGVAALAEKLQETSFDVVLIGAGVRRDDDHFLVFEQLVNIIHEFAPQARIAFNTGPTDSAAAVQRWA